MRFVALRRDAAYVILAMGLVAYYVAPSGGGFPLDDSWIHQTYARNLAQTGEWSFILGQPSAASTSPLYTVLLSIGYALNLPYTLWTHSLGVFALALTGIIGAHMSQHLLPQRPRLAWMVGLALISTWHLIWSAASGMETLLFAMLTLALIALAWHELETEQTASRALLARALRFGTVAAWLTLARPEGALLVGLLGALMLLVRPQGAWWRVIAWGSVAFISFGVWMAPYLWLNWHLTGGWLPNTAAAKFNQHAILLNLPYSTRYADLLISILAGGQILLMPAIVAYIWRYGRRNLLYVAPLLWAVGLIALYAARLPAAYQHGRYVIPALPALVLMGTLGMGLWWESLRNRRRQWVDRLWRVTVQTIGMAAALMILLFAFITAPDIYRVDVSIINQEMVASAHWIRDNLPMDDLLAIHDIGAVGYFAPRPMLDIAGLISPEVTPIVADADALWRLMQTRDVRYLMAFPDQIPGDNPNDPRLCEVFNTQGETARQVGGPNMSLYRLAWDGNCDL